MPSYLITSPEGSKYRVNAPEGATEQDALKYVQGHHSELQASLTRPDGPAPKADFPQAPEDSPLTLGGVAGSITRGIAPYAAGAGAGAAIGAMGGPIGAAGGAGAVMGAQALSSIYNGIAERMGWPKSATPQEMTDKLLDFVKERRPSNATERTLQSTAGGVASALSGAGLAGAVERAAAGPVTRSVAGKLAEGPARQAVSGGLGAVGAQTAAEQGAGPTGQLLASMATGSLPYGPNVVRNSIASTPRSAAMEARLADYVLPPASISEKPGLVSSVLAGWSGKIKTQQAASAKNQSVTNSLATRALGLPPETVLTDEVFSKVRQQAGTAYQAVSDAIPVIRADQGYLDTVAQLGGKNSQAAQFFPNITKNPGIKDLVQELFDVREFPTKASVEIVKELRFLANSNLKAIGDPSKHALGLAQREAANAVDDLMERNITAVGKPGVVDAYRSARRLIAKSYDVEGATNSATGDVNARGLARLQDKGRPLTDELKTIADVASAFPKAMQFPGGFGDNEKWSALDFFGSAAAMAHGNFGVMATIGGRPVGRAVVLSRPYQRAMTSVAPSLLPAAGLTQPGALGVVSPTNAVGQALGVPQQ